MAYRMQFNHITGRPHLGQSRIKSRLIGNNDPDERDLPPKPKVDGYLGRLELDSIVTMDYGTADLLARLLAKWNAL